ncbi:DNA/RNA helicase [Sulfitobacter donghicola DSW-25 = KCTC 12864 = JCM 14565]|nr:DUF927 domain-containing protein [Sulfitobacter donghicola]KIN70367.1 DNA/RNA helicase [Sulfitobacter donghicola DSW-25 = KCTC 12864 = JCM 14565]
MSDISLPDTNATMISPVPPNAPPCDLFNHPHFATAHCYYDEKGDTLFQVFRLEAPDPEDATKTVKTFRPAIFVANPDGSHTWQYKAPPAPRSLYGRPALATMSDAPVLIVEGETCADSAQEAFPTVAVVTWPGGSNSVRKADFSPLKGRNVMIMPDHDEAGAKAAIALVKILHEAGANSVRVIAIEALLKDKIGSAPKRGDIVDMRKAGATFNGIDTLPLLPDHDILDTLVAQEAIPPAPSVHAHLLEAYGYKVDLPEILTLNDNGLTKEVENNRGDRVTVFVASPIAVIGRSRTAADGAGWGKVVAYLTPLGTWETVVIPDAMTASDGREMRELLARRGVICGQCPQGRQALREHFAYAQTDTIVEVATRCGWKEQSFVLPDRVISPEGAPRILPPENNNAEHFFKTSGRFDGWRALSKSVAGSSRAVFGICVALSGPLARVIGETGGGFHLYDRSSRGKTSLLITAASVWGGGGRDGAVRSWTMTANGGEAIAAQHSDSFIALDEIGVASSDEVREAIYRMSNGQGKARANREGNATTSAQWFAMMLSSGEEPVATLLEGRGRGRDSSALTGGIAVRLVDIPHSVSEEQTFESIGEHESEATFAEWITAQAKTHYGHAGPAFVEHLVTNPNGAKKEIDMIISTFVKNVVDLEVDPQVRRIARRFGLAAAAGTLAARWKIVAWPEETAVRAAMSCFKAWLAARGTNGSTEEITALRQVAKFFESHGASRFEKIKRVENADGIGEDNESRSDMDTTVRDRCGYREDTNGMVYYVTPQAWRTEICAGLDPVYVAKLLRERGALTGDTGGRLQKNVRLPEGSRPVRVYMIRPDRIGDID